MEGGAGGGAKREHQGGREGQEEHGGRGRDIVEIHTFYKAAQSYCQGFVPNLRRMAKLRKYSKHN